MQIRLLNLKCRKTGKPPSCASESCQSLESTAILGMPFGSYLRLMQLCSRAAINWSNFVQVHTLGSRRQGLAAALCMSHGMLHGMRSASQIWRDASASGEARAACCGFSFCAIAQLHMQLCVVLLHALNLMRFCPCFEWN